MGLRWFAAALYCVHSRVGDFNLIESRTMCCITTAAIEAEEAFKQQQVQRQSPDANMDGLPDGIESTGQKSSGEA